MQILLAVPLRPAAGRGLEVKSLRAHCGRMTRYSELSHGPILPSGLPTARSIIGQGVGSRDHASTQGSHSTRPVRGPDLAANDRMNQILIEHLDPTAWRAKPPGKVRTIAAIFTHMHNVRSKWVRLTAPHLKVPRQLHRAHCTPQQARAGLAESAARCAEMLAEALGGCGGRVEKFRRDGWARPWPVWPGNA